MNDVLGFRRLKDVASRRSRCEMARLPSDTTNARDRKDAELLAAQRRKARRLGAVLWLVVFAIVAAVFAWKLSAQR
jgi:hypothetical protein